MAMTKQFFNEVKKQMGYTNGSDRCEICKSLKLKDMNFQADVCTVNTFDIPIELTGHCNHFKPLKEDD